MPSQYKDETEWPTAASKSAKETPLLHFCIGLMGRRPNFAYAEQSHALCNESAFLSARSCWVKVSWSRLISFFINVMIVLVVIPVILLCCLDKESITCSISSIKIMLRGVA